MSKILTVWGATGNQGGSLIRAVLADPVLSKEFKVRGVTRDVNKPAAKELAAQGVEMVSADMSTVESAATAVKGAHTVFLVTNFWESTDDQVEIAQGKAVTDACKAAGVKHLVFSSLLNTTEISEGRLPNISHFVGKAQIEQYIRDSGVPATFVLPGLFMTGFFGTIRKGEDGSFALAMPVPTDKAQIPLFDAAADMGRFTIPALKNFPACVGKRILAADDYYTPDRLMKEFSEVIGQPASAKQVPPEVFKSFLPPPVAQELLENFQLLGDVGYYAGADLSESLGMIEGKPKSWKEFVAENKEKWLTK